MLNKNSRICRKCKGNIPWGITIDGKYRNLASRKYCLNCSPFGKHNTSKLEVDKTFKTCKRCEEEKPLTEFYMKTDGYPYVYCKSCMNKKRNNVFIQNKIDAVNYLGGKCQCCGYNKHYAALDFHHKDPSKKDFAISKNRYGSIEKIKPELDKCILLCANCHRETHAGLHTWE